MRYRKLKFIIIPLLGIGLLNVHSQETVSATGGTAVGSNGSASYTIGQVVYNEYSDNKCSVMQGVQQPYEILVISQINQTQRVTLQCIAYPNPAIDVLTLKVENFEYSSFRFQLFDINGSLLESRKVLDKETDIDMNNYSSATYLLKVIENNKEVKAFKINKK